MRTHKVTLRCGQPSCPSTIAGEATAQSYFEARIEVAKKHGWKTQATGDTTGAPGFLCPLHGGT